VPVEDVVAVFRKTDAAEEDPQLDT